MALQALADHLHQARVKQSRKREVLIETPLPAERSSRNRFRSKLRQAKFLERNLRQVQRLRPTVVDLAVDAILVVAARIVLNAILGIEQQDRARSKDHSVGRTHACASRLQTFFQAVFAQLALGHARIESHPLETRNVKRARDGAVTTADALVGVPLDDPALRILVQRLERATRLN